MNHPSGHADLRFLPLAVAAVVAAWGAGTWDRTGQSFNIPTVVEQLWIVVGAAAVLTVWTLYRPRPALRRAFGTSQATRLYLTGGLVCLASFAAWRMTTGLSAWTDMPVPSPTVNTNLLPLTMVEQLSIMAGIGAILTVWTLYRPRSTLRMSAKTPSAPPVRRAFGVSAARLYFTGGLICLASFAAWRLTTGPGGWTDAQFPLPVVSTTPLALPGERKPLILVREWLLEDRAEALDIVVELTWLNTRPPPWTLTVQIRRGDREHSVLWQRIHAMPPLLTNEAIVQKLRVPLPERQRFGSEPVQLHVLFPKTHNLRVAFFPDDTQYVDEDAIPRATIVTDDPKFDTKIPLMRLVRRPAPLWWLPGQFGTSRWGSFMHVIHLTVGAVVAAALAVLGMRALGAGFWQLASAAGAGTVLGLSAIASLASIGLGVPLGTLVLAS